MENKTIKCEKHGEYEVKEIYCKILGRSIILDRCPKCIEEFNEKFNFAVKGNKKEKKPTYSCYKE